MDWTSKKERNILIQRQIISLPRPPNPEKSVRGHYDGLVAAEEG
jgi:hypothetical protein